MNRIICVSRDAITRPTEAKVICLKPHNIAAWATSQVGFCVCETLGITGNQLVFSRDQLHQLEPSRANSKLDSSCSELPPYERLSVHPADGQKHDVCIYSAYSSPKSVGRGRGKGRSQKALQNRSGPNKVKVFPASFECFSHKDPMHGDCNHVSATV